MLTPTIQRTISSRGRRIWTRTVGIAAAPTKASLLCLLTRIPKLLPDDWQ